MKKQALIYFIFFGICFSLTAQDNTSELFIKTTSSTIHKAQKEMIRSQKNDVNGSMAKAVILQNNALALYKAHHNEKAVCVSALARKYAASVIKTVNGTVGAFYLIHEDEEPLLTNCANDNDLYTESKHVANNPSEQDKDYMTSFNNLSIDFD